MSAVSFKRRVGAAALLATAVVTVSAATGYVAPAPAALAAPPAVPTVSAAPLVGMDGVEGPEDAGPSGSAGANAELVTDFFTQAFDQRDVAGAARAYLAENYIQHNPQTADGRDAFVAAIGPYVKDSGVDFRIGRVIASGDLVVIHSEATEGNGARSAVADFFRVENGKIAEHWDVIQSIPDASVNSNGMVS